MAMPQRASTVASCFDRATALRASSMHRSRSSSSNDQPSGHDQPVEAVAGVEDVGTDRDQDGQQ